MRMGIVSNRESEHNMKGIIGRVLIILVLLSALALTAYIATEKFMDDKARAEEAKNGTKDAVTSANDALEEAKALFAKDSNVKPAEPEEPKEPEEDPMETLDKLIGLKEADVGAIYLGSASTDYHLNDASNNTNGMIRQTGIFLRESGGVGTVQHVDLAV